MTIKLDLIDNQELVKKFQLNIKNTEIEKTILEKLKEKQKNISIPGFRIGKVPFSIIKRNYYKTEVDNYIRKEAPQIAIKNIEKKYKFTISERPIIKVVNFNQEGLILEITIKIIAEIPNLNYTLISIDKFNVQPTNKDIEYIKKKILQDFKQYIKTNNEYKIKDGDKVTIEYQGKIDNKEFEGSKAKNFEIQVGSNLFLQDIEKGCIGMKKGENKEITVIFPKNYPKKELASKRSSFQITITNILEGVMEKKITDNILKKLNLKNEEELEKAIRKKIQFDMAPIIRNEMKQELFAKIDQDYNFNLPKTLIEEEFHNQWEQYLNKEQKSSNNDNVQEIKNKLYQASRKKIKMWLIITKIIRDNEIKVEEDELQTIINTQIANKPESKDKILEFYKKKDNLDKLKGVILEEKSIDFLFKKIHIISKSISTDDLKKIIDHNNIIR